MLKPMKRLFRRVFEVIVPPIARWIERERAIRELSLLGERELAELGITPAMIPYAASPKFTADSIDDRRRGAANDNGARRRDAASA